MRARMHIDILDEKDLFRVYVEHTHVIEPWESNLSYEELSVEK